MLVDLILEKTPYKITLHRSKTTVRLMCINHNCLNQNDGNSHYRFLFTSPEEKKNQQKNLCPTRHCLRLKINCSIKL